MSPKKSCLETTRQVECPYPDSNFPDTKRHTTLSSNHTARPESIIKQLEVGFLEEALRGTFRVGGIRNDDVERVLVVIQEFEAVADMDPGLRVLEAFCHAGQILLR